MQQLRQSCLDPYPASDAPRWKWDEFHNKRMLRLEEGDTGYNAWITTKHAFRAEVSQAFQDTHSMAVDALGNVNSTDPDANLLDKIIAIFSLKLPSF
jgi:hypothetical protein